MNDSFRRLVRFSTTVFKTVLLLPFILLDFAVVVFVALMVGVTGGVIVSFPVDIVGLPPQVAYLWGLGIGFFFLLRTYQGRGGQGVE